MDEEKVNGVHAFDVVEIQPALFTSSTKRRIAELHTIHEKLENNELPPQDRTTILQYLTTTYPLYVDRPSRLAVQQCLRAIISAPEAGEHLVTLSKFLQDESAKMTLASDSIFVLVEWCSVILQVLASKAELWEKFGLKIVTSQARVLDKCLGSASRDSRKHSALVITRRALRAIFKAKPIGVTAANDIIALLTAKSSSPISSNTVLLGVVAGVGHRIASVRPVIVDRASDYYAFYIREVLGSRTVLPRHTASGLTDFFSSFLTLDALMKELAPAIEKALLRAPEVVLDDILLLLVKSFNKEIDLAEALKKHFTKPLIANAKSTNATVREGARASFEQIAQHARDEQLLAQVVDEVLKALKEAKNAEHRVIFSAMLSSVQITETTSKSLAAAINPLVTKETNEGALVAEIRILVALVRHAARTKKAIDPTIIKAFMTGLADKKPAVRRVWALQCGEIIWTMADDTDDTAQLNAFLDGTVEKLAAAWEEVIANPIAATQSGLVIVAHIFAAIALTSDGRIDSAKVSATIKKAGIEKALLGTDGKPGFLTNHRIYGKFINEDDFIWHSRALFASAKSLLIDNTQPSTSLGWSQAILFVLNADTVPPNARRQAYTMLNKAYFECPVEIAESLTAGIWQWLRNLEMEDKDTPATTAKSNKSRLHLVLNSTSITPENRAQGRSVDATILDTQLINLLVLCREPLIPRVQWIELCLRGGVDPGDLVRRNLNSCLEAVKAPFANTSDAFAEQVNGAACDAAAELCFVAPEIFLPRLIDLIKDDLNADQLQSLGPTEAAIFRTPAGTTFVDVLSQKPQSQVPAKNAKDYDTMKWEEELRAQLAQKKGQERKLTADEQAKVKAQLAKEDAIRKEVGEKVVRLRRGVGFVKSLNNGPPTDPEAWFGSAVGSLLHVIDGGAALIIGNEAVEAFLDCANKVTTRLGALRPFLGIASMRILGTSHLAPGMEEEPLGDLVTRILYRLRFSSEQRPFDVVSLIYMLPLIQQVLTNGGAGRSAGDEADEQVTLALEFLSFHVDQFSSERLPRLDIVALLIASMQKYNQHYKLIKDCLLSVARAMAPDITQQELAVFLQGAIVPETSVRSSVLQALDEELEVPSPTFCAEIWLASHEDNEENAEIARSIWEENSLVADADAATTLLPYLERKDAQLRRAAARALADCVRLHPDIFDKTINALQEIYVEKARPRVPERDAYGMPRKMDLADPWESRHGVALAFKQLVPSYDPATLATFIRFLIENGPLADRNGGVRDQMVDASTTLISHRGESQVEDLMNMFETTLEAPDSGAKDHDLVNEAVIIMYGALARHLKTGDARIPKVVHRLLATLSTPSETVQYAIASCLPPLVQNSPAETTNYVKVVMEDLLKAKKYASRRGAAYGLAGIVAGKGISALREFRIMSSLRAASEEKKDQTQRQGAFLAYELLSLILGPVFEPYVIQVVPQLLTGFGDSSADVREACLDAAKQCFSSLSSFGVKQVLPTLLEGLDDQQWRSKKGACDSLGAMAYLDPQQLAISLPEIIPPLTTVLTDSHKEVRSSANRSLQRFGDVISNPEIKGVVDILLKALSDPTKFTDDALDALLKVNFIHYLDAPSLALVVRILERGLGDRSATKRKSSQIIGSLAHLTERKDLVGHLPILVSGLRVAAVDPVPATRATSSKALGSLVEKLGEDALPDLIPSLMSALKTDTGAGDRLGSAQALSEVLAGLGVGRLEETLPSILQNVSSAKASVREGFMSLFIFLPACFGNGFANYLNRVIPPILAGLADEVESIRETSLRAGRLLVKNFATRAIDLLLPELQRGLADDSHRIRLSSVELVGDLLFNLTGITAKADSDEVEENATAAGQSLLDVLGEEKRNNILSALYVSRCDTSGLVRTAAVNVWKALVATPRTLREITPTLTQVIIRRLASSNMEQKVIAGNALGELIRKAGESVMSTLLPTLEEGLQNSVDTDAKQGICIALRELITSASPESLEEHEPKLISVVRTALLDANADVRDAAAEAFDSMQRLFGKKVIDQVLPKLLGLLQSDDEADNALAALLTLLTENTRSSVILPNLLPTLLASPISTFNARALASLASVAGSAMTRRLSNIFNSLLDNIVACKDEERREALEAAFDAVLLSVDEYDGLNTAMSVMLALTKHTDHRKRATADAHLATFLTKADIDYSRYYADLIRALLISFDDGDADVVKSAWTALNALTTRLRKEDMESLVISTRQVLNQVGVPGHDLAGFLLPKGINAILPIFLQGLINGTPEQRTQSALAISEMIDKTSGDSLKPFVTQITGPLIRVVSERSVEVKAAILLTLNHLLEKIPTLLKPFLPQLQRTFTKALADTSSETLRTRAARALGTLITMTPRIDPLIGELVAGSRTPDAGVKAAMQKALYEVISKVGASMSEASRAAVVGLIDDDAGATADDATAVTAARLLGALARTLAPDAAAPLLRARALPTNPSRASLLALNAILLDSPAALLPALAHETVTAIAAATASPDPAVAENAVLAAGKYLLLGDDGDAGPAQDYETTRPLFDALAAQLAPGRPIDARRLGLVVVRTLARSHPSRARPHLALLAPPVFAGVRDPVIPVKLAAEQAWLALFCVVDDEAVVFDRYLAGAAGAALPVGTKRAMTDYFKRVAVRLGAQARERREAEGGQGGLGLSQDERDDEREIWSVGRVDLGEASFE